MPLLLHDTFSGSAGNLDSSVPDVIGSAWTLTEVWANATSANADTAFGVSPRSKLARNGSGICYTTSGRNISTFGYGILYKAGCTVPNNFDLEVGLRSKSGQQGIMWVLWRASLDSLSPPGKGSSWAGLLIDGALTYSYRMFDGVGGTHQNLTSPATAPSGAVDVLKFSVSGSTINTWLNGVSQPAVTYGSMPGSGNVYIGYGMIYYGAGATSYYGTDGFAPDGAGGSYFDYIKIADPGDLNAPVSTRYKNSILCGGLI